jgi:hypothetical protein
MEFVTSSHSVHALQRDPSHPPSGFAKLQQATINDNAGYPGFEGRFAAKVSQTAEGQEESRLHGVLCVFRLSQNTACEPKGRPVMATK